MSLHYLSLVEGSCPGLEAVEVDGWHFLLSTLDVVHLKSQERKEPHGDIVFSSSCVEKWNQKQIPKHGWDIVRKSCWAGATFQFCNTEVTKQ